VSAEPRDVAAEVAEQLQADRMATIKDLGAIPMLWFAAAPLWTRSAAEAARFPMPVAGFIERAVDAGWCKTRGRADPYFWITDDARREVTGDLRTLLRSGQFQKELTKVAQAVAGIGKRRLARRPEPLTVPGALRAWAELITSAEPARIPDILVERAGKAVADYDGDYVQELIAACTALTPLVGGTGGGVLDRAHRILTLGTRREQLERTLDHYLDRPELTGAVARLLEPGTSLWALHLRGVGGVGKTMLIRYLLSGRYAADRGLAPIPLAAVDFDYIAPDYPFRRPAQLLVELTDDLRLHTATDELADRALDSFRSRATRAHEAADALSYEAVSSQSEADIAPLQRPEVSRAADDFASALRELGDNVLLILDTCEELAKAETDEPASSAVSAMLDMIEYLHERAPGVRVLLAGRRPLPVRGYLAVQPVAGFTIEESRRYLAEAVPRPLAPELADAIIRQSAAVDGPAPPPGSVPERTSPFDLALYAAWAATDPELNVAQVEMGGDGYVERRIIRRLQDPLVADALPMLAAAGSARVRTLAQVLECDADDLRGRLLAQGQEWGGAFFLTHGRVVLSPALAKRLREYFSAPARQPQVRYLNERLALDLVSDLAITSLASIDLDDLLAALRLATPGQAAALWDQIADRATDPPGHWGTVHAMTQRIIAAWEEEAWPTTRALGATVYAAHIAAIRHNTPALYQSDMWEAVVDTAADHPDPAKAQVLLGRANLGLLGTLPWPRTEDPSPADASLAAAAVDAVHRLLERGDLDGAARLSEQLQTSGLIDGAGPRVRAWAYVAAARLEAGRDPQAAHALLIRAEVAAVDATGPEPAWADWIPPDDLLARVRIEHGLIAPEYAARELGTWELYAADRTDTIDGERLASLCLRLRLGHRVVGGEDIERWERIDRYQPDQVPACTAHDLVPPLFTSIAEAWLSGGRPARTLDVLESRRAEALATRGDEVTVRQADAELIRLTRRLRLGGQRSLLSRLATEPGPARLAAWRAQAVVYREVLVVEPLSDAESWHAYWQCRTVNSATLPPFPEGPGDDPTAAADIAADLEELRQLLGPALDVEAPSWIVAGDHSPVLRRSAAPYQYLRARIREAALSGATFVPDALVPPRTIADMAFEEAELTALRLPEVAGRLFRMSAEWYGGAGDHLGALLATAALPASDHPAELRDALSELREQDPELCATLTGELPVGSPWRYWADVIRQVDGASDGPRAVSVRETSGVQVGDGNTQINYYGDRDQNAAPVTRYWERAEHVRTVRAFALMATAAVLVLSAAATGAVGALLSGQAATAIEVVTAAIAAGQFVLAITAAWHGVKFLWYAGDRRVGVSRLATVAFDATIAAGVRASSTVILSVGPRPWRAAPLRVRLLSWFPVIRPPEPIRGISQYGYRGSLTGPSVVWDGPGPLAADRWWKRRGDSAPGTIRVARPDASQPWERILAAALGDAAAGRIEWCRIVDSASALGPSEHKQASLAASPSWRRELGEQYPVASGAVHHVIGRAVDTAGGPAMDLAGELVTTQLITGSRPQLVILQAEPAGDARVPGPSDDIAEKLALAAALIEDGIPSVLLLPVLPAALARRIAGLVTAHATARRRDDPRVLLVKVRKLITGHVSPTVLDNVILFLNSCRFD
jgi:hypothetical protein